MTRKSTLAMSTVGAALVFGCTQAEDPAAACAAAATHLDALRSTALIEDPVLRDHPELAAEHVRQTSAVFAEPLRVRCAGDPKVAQCVSHSATFDQASKCL